jgi:DNA mismatch repair protein MutL
MADIVRLLPDSVANQIAAGEVIQRPASVVKELMENALDAGANKILVQLKDAGRTFIRVMDDGKGMSEADARLCFERHATSKLKTADDLFQIRTMGFRGEALASIAAVAQVELVTRPKDRDLGLQVVIHGSQLKEQGEIQASTGTKLTVHNLFYNVPARRNFLKSDKVEMRHVIDEFERVALAYPEIEMRLVHNDQELFRLKGSGDRQRIVDIFGRKYNERLVPVAEETDILKIEGFIGKPEYARKTRGEQFFFVNDRFIRSPYLHRAVNDAFEGLLKADAFPSYFIRLQLSPEFIDVNIHPTKTEIKFEDERTVYALLKASIKKSLGQFSIAPSLDFDIDPDMIPDTPSDPGNIKVPTIEVDPNYNPFRETKTASSSSSFTQKSPVQGDKQWERLMEGVSNEDLTPQQEEMDWETSSESYPCIQLHQKYILAQIKSGFMILHQQRAHERVLYEHLLQSKEEVQRQQLLFHQTLHFKQGDETLLLQFKEDIKALGYELESFGPGTLLVKSVPAGTSDQGLQAIFDGIVERIRLEQEEWKNKARENLVLYLAKRLSIRSGQSLNRMEMQDLIDRLFACTQPYHTADGHKTMITLELEDLDKRFEK